MVRKPILFAAALLILPGAASAQDAVETAVITGTTGPAAKGSGGTLGRAVSGAMNRVATTLDRARKGQAERPGATRGAPAYVGRGRKVGGRVVLGDGDPLEGTDAETVSVASGATLHFSRGFRPAAPAECSENWEAGAATDANSPD